MPQDYIPGQAISKVLDPISLVQAYQASDRLEMQKRYLELAESRVDTAAVSKLLESYKTGFSQTEGIFDDLRDMDKTGYSLASYINSDKGQDVISTYPQLAPFAQWAGDYMGTDTRISDALTTITTDTGTDNIGKYQALLALEDDYPTMGRQKGPYDSLTKQYKKKHDTALATKFLNEHGESYDELEVKRWRAMIQYDPEKAWVQINEANEPARKDKLLDQINEVTTQLANPLLIDANVRASLNKEMEYLEEQAQRFGIFEKKEGPDSAPPMDATLYESATQQIVQKNPNAFNYANGEITSIKDDKAGVITSAINSVYQSMLQAKREQQTQTKVSAAAQAGIVLPGSEEWEKLYGAPTVEKPKVALAGATLSDTTKTIPPPVPPVQPVSGEVFYDASIGRWLTSEGKPATRGQIAAAKGKGKQVVKPPAPPKVEKPVVKKELPPPQPGEAGRMPKLTFSRYNQYGAPVFKTSAEPTGTTFPIELKQYRGDYTTQEQKKFQDITKKLKSDRSVYKDIKEQKDKVKNLESKRDALVTGRSGYDKAKKYYNDKIKTIEKKKIGPLKERLSAPEFYDQVIAGFYQ